MPRHLVAALAAAACSACNPATDGEGQDVAVAISAIQGSGAASPFAGQTVSVPGLVSGDFQHGDGNPRNDLGGFYLQSLEPDDDPRTSEGLFVFDRNAETPDVAVGDVVSVTGKVVEHHGETQLVATGAAVTGRGELRNDALALPAARVVANADGVPVADLERFEGMRVVFDAELYVQDLYGLERHGEMILSTEPREYQFTNFAVPDPAGFAAHRETLAARSIRLDDGRSDERVSPPRYLDAVGPGRLPRVGDAVTALTGVLRYARGSGADGHEDWCLMPVEEPRFEVRNPRPSPPEVRGDAIVASVNLLNWFTTLDLRGADSAAEFERQRLRTARALAALDADVIGVMELENDARESIAALTAALGTVGPGWRFVDTGVIGDDAIRVGLLYRGERVQPVGEHAILNGGVDARFDDNRNRPVLAQTFRAANGGIFTVAVNHLKSKGSPCDEDGDPDRGDGQGNCSGTRLAAALALADWLAGDPTGSGDEDVLIIGDLNAYLEEDPVRALEDAGYVNLLERHAGEKPYSFVFRGASGALDHAFANASLALQVTGASEWHANADEAALYDYNLDFGREPALFDASAPWRASDHDPLVVGLALEPD